MKLDIGCGPIPHAADFRTVDLYYPADIHAPMWELPLSDGSVDVIWSAHALEHVAGSMVLPTLREWHRVLSPTGYAEILVPDLDYVARYWLEHPGTPRALDIMFGNQTNEGQFHKTGWNRPSFRAALKEAGFSSVSTSTIRSHGQETIRAVARR